MPDKKNGKRKRTKLADFLQDDQFNVADKIDFVKFSVDSMIDFEDTLSARIERSKSDLFRGTLKTILERHEKTEIENIAKAVANQTGAPLEQILNKETRTPEQQTAMLEESARRQKNRMLFFLDSNYAKALQTLDEVNTPFDKEEDPLVMGIKEFYLYYYFATHPVVDPLKPALLNDSNLDLEALVSQYKRFVTFFISYFGSVKKAVSFQHSSSEWSVDGNEWTKALEDFIVAENPADAQEIIEHLSSVLPEKYVIPNNKLANTMTKDIIDIGRITLEESKKGAKKLVETTCILTYEGDNVHLSGRQPFTEYDRNVYDAVSSLYVYGDPSHVVTAAQVYRAMTGLTDTEKPTSGQLAAVTRSLDKMRFIRARIDCTAEFQARRITLNSQQINGGEIDTYLLTADAVKVQAGGQTVKAYRIIKTPILYEYAAAVNQVLTLPASTLDIKELNPDGSAGARLPNTESRILIKGYLIRRIEGMKGKNGLNNPVVALYDYQRNGETHQGLYSIAGKPDAASKEKQRIREDAEKMLDYWQAIEYIKGYEIQTQRSKITGYKITV